MKVGFKVQENFFICNMSLPNRHGVFQELCFTHCSEINVVSADNILLPDTIMWPIIF